MSESEAFAPRLARIIIFPVKALDGLELPEAQVLPSGALAWDRRYAIFDEAGKYVNGKKNARVHLLRSSFDLGAGRLSLWSAGLAKASFDVQADREALEQWLKAFFGIPLSFRENAAAGFPDDTESPGPTVISTATLREVGGWFDLSVEQVRARFRSNLEIDGVPAFWEDRLFGPAGTLVRFSIGGVEFDGNNPCQRCVVPPRDPLTGENNADFMKRFMELRKQSLPPWAEVSRFNHFYRLAVNTRPAGPGGRLSVGDELRVLGPLPVGAA
ncbi:MAG TPA: MOSC N-terminal beta barrel domain-containing protein [bacterium]|jgi:uncharacterized protein YcbX|nr:MOSC N-terminal beta barrel domain-containing protein [bacterium]